jgi:hypothetical protein
MPMVADEKWCGEQPGRVLEGLREAGVEEQAQDQDGEQRADLGASTDARHARTEASQ